MTPAELIEAELRKYLRIRLGRNASVQAVAGEPVMLSGTEAETAARLALEALDRAGLVVISAEDHHELVALLDELSDTDPCDHFDHDGECQTHGPTSTWEGCPHARAREVLAALPEGSSRG